MEGHLAQGTSALGSERMLPSQESFLHGVLLDPFAPLLCPLPPCPAVGPEPWQDTAWVPSVILGSHPGHHIKFSFRLLVAGMFLRPLTLRTVLQEAP